MLPLPVVHYLQVLASLNTVVCGLAAKAHTSKLAKLQRAFTAARDCFLFASWLFMSPGGTISPCVSLTSPMVYLHCHLI